MRKLFITGTDTDVGKTEVAVLLLNALARAGFDTVAMKPIAAGCEWRAVSSANMQNSSSTQTNGADSESPRSHHQSGYWVNEDALKLQAAATLQLPYSKVNPFAYEPAIAPHIAAMAEKNSAEIPLSVTQLLKHWQHLAALDADVLITEGAGGWQLPLNALEDMPSFVSRANMDVILVVGMRLGCLNHALLTISAIKALGLKVAGWVANQATPDVMPMYKENLATLRSRIAAPLLAEVPHFSGAEMEAQQQVWLEQQNWLSQLKLSAKR